MTLGVCQRELVILMYHAVVRSRLVIDDWCFLEEDLFRQQMEYLGANHEVLSLGRAIELPQESASQVPAVAITFDDGFQNNLDVVLPILERLGLPATVFLPTELVGSRACIWFCQVNKALTTTRRSTLSWRGREYDLATKQGRAHASSALQAHLKTYSHPQLLKELHSLVRELGEDPDETVGEDSPYRILGEGGIRRMLASGLITFGAHTESHAILGLLPKEEQEREILASIARVRALTGSPCELFAFPNGRPQDYDEGCIAVLQAADIKGAVTTTEGLNEPGQPLLELKRFGIGSGTSRTAFEEMLEGVRL